MGVALTNFFSLESISQEEFFTASGMLPPCALGGVSHIGSPIIGKL